jgi:PAS domain S-box-containing protein
MNVSLTEFFVLDALHCITIVIDQHAVIHHVNHKFEQLTGLTRDQLIGKSAFPLCGDDAERELLRKAISRFFESTREERFTLPSPTGVRFPVVASAGILDLPNTQHLRVVSCIDITQLEQANASRQLQYETVVQMSNTIIDQALQLRDNNSQLEDRVRQRSAELQAANLDAIFMLAEAAEAKDHHTATHLRRVESLSKQLALCVGFTQTEAEQIGYASILHDVGKLHVPDHILNKPGPLTDEEQAVMRQHTVIGQRIIVDKPFFRSARLIARHHHENFDGTGYPDHLSGNDIPIEARIVHVADVYDALTSSRSYKPAWTREEALLEMTQNAGAMFDPVLVDLLKQQVVEE